jgi:Zn-dependent peptidase ImmA (M78 family)
MCWKRRVILLENDRTKWERRCDLTHAIAHIDLAHRRLDDKSEAAAVRYAAKMLIDLEPLSAALSMSEGQITPDAADALGVDEQTLMARLQHLHPGERGYLMRELAHLYAEHVA